MLAPESTGGLSKQTSKEVGIPARKGPSDVIKQPLTTPEFGGTRNNDDGRLSTLRRLNAELSISTASVRLRPERVARTGGRNVTIGSLGGPPWDTPTFRKFRELNIGHQVLARLHNMTKAFDYSPLLHRARMKDRDENMDPEETWAGVRSANTLVATFSDSSLNLSNSQVYVAFAIVIGGRRSTHTAITGTSSLPPPSSQVVSTTGRARRDANDVFVALRDRATLGAKPTLSSKGMGSIEIYENWHRFHMFGHFAIQDGDTTKSASWSQTNFFLKLELDQLRLAVLQDPKLTPAQKLRLESDAVHIRRIDATLSLKRGQQLELSDAHLSLNHNWSESSVEQQLEEYLKGTVNAMEGGGPPPTLTDPELGRLSVDATVLMMRSLHRTRRQDPKKALNLLLRLANLTCRLWASCPALWNWRRFDGTTFGIEQAQWAGRAGLRITEIVRAIIDVQNDELVKDARTKLAELRRIVIQAVREDLKWIQILTDQELLAGSEIEAVAAWCQYRVQEGIPAVCIENVRLLLEWEISRAPGLKKELQNLDPMFGLRELNLILGAMRVGSFMYAALEEEATKFEEQVRELETLALEAGSGIGSHLVACGIVEKTLENLFLQDKEVVALEQYRVVELEVE
ncbi:hypothetical protein T439DRAFT_383744 [Meredithblackwellia eburnea MCA 4105]